MKELQTGYLHENFMERCLELASNGLGRVAPNPMVGAVLVYNGRIIGEGYHRQYGEPHAEVNAINSVSDESILKDSILYVNLEPCAHTGKTPPCTGLILRKGIPRVVIGTSDPNSLVAGKGIAHLKEHGVHVEQNILAEKCFEINRRFFTYHRKKRPYIILKWAQTTDGYIDTLRKAGEPIGVNWISNSLSQMLVHKWRAEEQAILIGTNTVLTDNPQLTVRHWTGKNPVRVIPDRKLRLPRSAVIFSGAAPTLIINGIKADRAGSTEWIKMELKRNDPEPVLAYLYDQEIQSLIIEGGKTILENFIENNLWDEARIFIGNKIFEEGVKAPDIKSKKMVEEKIRSDRLLIFRR
jgi:diaminohydroxyphosphoribosylaminopyrimidine deaminase/5-amino-6-(5-phosphoribosylamino)uracil reductase